MIARVGVTEQVVYQNIWFCRWAAKSGLRDFASNTVINYKK